MAYRINGTEVSAPVWWREMDQVALEDRRERCQKIVSRDVVRGDAEQLYPQASSGD